MITKEDADDLQLVDEAMQKMDKHDPRWSILANHASRLLTKICGYPVSIHVCKECNGNGCPKCASVGYCY